MPGGPCSRLGKLVMKPRVFVTGATGFVGSHITQRFVESGFRVRCGQRNTSSGRWLENLEVEPWTFELGDPKGFQAALDDVDVVVHAAGVTSARTEAVFRAVNTDGTVELAKAARCAGVRRFVYISSLAARGPDRALQPGRDLPISPYGVSKLEAESGLRALVADLEVIVLRPVTVYGPRDSDLLRSLKWPRPDSWSPPLVGEPYNLLTWLIWRRSRWPRRWLRPDSDRFPLPKLPPIPGQRWFRHLEKHSVGWFARFHFHLPCSPRRDGFPRRFLGFKVKIQTSMFGGHETWLCIAGLAIRS